MFSINLQSRQPIYDQLYSQIVRLISLEALSPGDKLPPVRNLAFQLGINPNTVAKTYSMLERDGIICTAVGKGSFISSDISVLQKKRQLACEEIDKAIKQALDCGVSKQDILEYIEILFENSPEGGNNGARH